MLSTAQQALIQAIDELNLAEVQLLLTEIEPNFMSEQGPPISVLSDRVFTWWEMLCDAYEADKPLSEEEKQQELSVYLAILESLIQAGANVHLWDSEELYGPLWDVASAACEPMVRRLLQEQVNPNTLDDEGQTILSSISHLFFECDYDEIDWSNSYPEIKLTLDCLRENGAKMTKELS